AIVGFRGLKSSAAAPVSLRELPSTYARIFRNPLAKICYGAVLTEAICLFGVMPYVAGLLAERGATRAALPRLVLAGCGVGGIFYASSVSLLLRRLGERGLMLGGGTLMGCALMLVALPLPWWLQGLVFILMGLGFYALHGVIQIYASELAPT